MLPVQVEEDNGSTTMSGPLSIGTRKGRNEDRVAAAADGEAEPTRWRRRTWAAERQTGDLHTLYAQSRPWRPVPRTKSVSLAQNRRPSPTRRRSGVAPPPAPRWVPERLRMYAQETARPSVRRGEGSASTRAGKLVVTPSSVGSEMAASRSVVRSDKIARRIAKLGKELA